MHPHYYHHMGRYWHRGPSRLVWFAIGAFAATWWLKRKDGDRFTWGHCRRLPPQSYPPVEPAPQSAAPGTNTWSLSDIPRTINNFPPADAFQASSERGRNWGNKPEGRYEWLTEEEKERFANMSRQATEAMAELTESTLDSVLSTAQALKAKLAEHRAQRENQQQAFQREVEEKHNTPHPA